jgi:hypothetical protein
MSATQTGRDWLEMSPGHFDATLLPKTRKSAPGQDGLFSVADVAAPKTRKSARTEPELDGQQDLFGLLGE